MDVPIFLRKTLKKINLPHLNNQIIAIKLIWKILHILIGMGQKYVKKIDASSVYDVVIRSPITLAENLSLSLCNKIFLKKLSEILARPKRETLRNVTLQ